MVPDKVEKKRIYRLTSLFLKVIARNQYSLNEKEKKILRNADIKGINTLVGLICDVARKGGFIPNDSERKEISKILKTYGKEEYSFYTSNAIRPIRRGLYILE